MPGSFGGVIIPVRFGGVPLDIVCYVGIYWLNNTGHAYRKLPTFKYIFRIDPVFHYIKFKYIHFSTKSRSHAALGIIIPIQ